MDGVLTPPWTEVTGANDFKDWVSAGAGGVWATNVGSGTTYLENSYGMVHPHLQNSWIAVLTLVLY